MKSKLSELFFSPIKMIVRAYIVSNIQNAIKSNKDNVLYWCNKVGIWIAKIEVVLSFLKSLKKKLDDGVLDDDEAYESLEEIKYLSKDIMC